MTFAETLAFLAALIAPEPDSRHFAPLLDGGPVAATPITITPCRRPLAPTEIERQTVICGTVTVPEDHDAADGTNSVELSFAILRSHSTYPAEDPVAYLHGGPGMGNLHSGLAGLARVFDKFRTNRDVVIFDQRAAGISSSSVACQDALTANVVDIALDRASLAEQDEDAAFAPTTLLTGCLAELAENGTDISRYNTRQNALDVPVVMQALGYESWNLYGISYGTKLTLEVLRTAPEGTRSAVIDGVAPPIVKLYDTLALPFSEATQRLVDDCAADAACAAAYPDLGRVISEVIALASEGKLTFDGETLPPATPLTFIAARNENPLKGSLTPYLPAMFYELHREGERPTLELVVGDWKMAPPLPTVETLQAQASAALTEPQMEALSQALKNAQVSDMAGEAFGLAVTELRAKLRRDRELGPLPSLLDAELSAALPDTIATPEAAAAAAKEYAALKIGDPTRERLMAFIEKNFDGPHLGRLLRIVEAMTESEISAVYSDLREAVERRTLDFQQSVDLLLYACQEDIPYNNLQGYDAVTAALPFDFSAMTDSAAAEIFASCSAFKPVERTDFHAVVESDIPVLSIGSGWDVQTAASWAESATEGLSNARSVFIAEAGHGAILYQPCVGDMTAAFFNDPGRDLDDGCERASAVPAFYIAPWVGKEDKETGSP
ncbi:alpha/beta hydrolase [Rhodobacteraceae bacterium DSL-40]|uniref:alpha/beta fold hydrolase n=1 Tax=Amaricoccus sp. B4 TaxID=3368557 RepID=UPI000DAE5DDD